jgi:acyl dehydratase
VNELFSADFDAVREGIRFSSRRRTISETDVGLFAALTGDRHPVHTDARWAAESLFGERIAHGLLVLSCAVGMVPFDPERVVALRRVRDLVFKRPVRLGESIGVEGKVRSAIPLDEANGLVAIELRVLGGDGKLALRAVLEIIWKREPSPAEELRAVSGGEGG